MGPATPGPQSEEAIRERQEADERVGDYVRNQLSRIRSNSMAISVEDEFEARLDE